MATKRAVYDIAEFKAATDRPGEFEALVSVFGNVDLQGDRVMPTAFDKSLDRWKASGDPIPVIWSHDWQDPFAHIGYVTKAVPTAKGLLITGKNDIDKPFAAQVHDLLVSRRVKGMSFAYDVIDERRAKDGANELVELNLIEAGPTLVGANSDAQLIQAKSLLDEAAAKEIAEEADEIGTKAGRRLSQATRARLQAMRDELDGLLAEDAASDGEVPKSALPRHSTATSGGVWDGPARQANVTSPNDGGAAYFRQIYAWQDSAGDPTVKASYRFIHHEVGADGTPGPANLTACSTGIGVLNGGRGGTTIPDADRQGVYRHLAAHISDGGQTPPDLKNVPAPDHGDGTDVDAEDREPLAKSDRDDNEKQPDDDQEPLAKSPDDELLLLKTRIEKVRAETRRSP